MTAKQFLQKHRQSASCVNVKQSMDNFTCQMGLGLSGKGGSLPMIPTYLMDVDRSKIVVDSKRILIDAGGTNFRSAVGYFDGDGNVHIDNLQKTTMPASDRLLTKDQFYGQIAQNISNLLPMAQNVGFCFSYQVDMDKDVDGTVAMFSKEVKAPEVIGTRVGAETLLACKQYSNVDRKIVILNDTVATLLGGMAVNSGKFGAYLGYIYGTGTNVCYIEDTANITKVDGLPKGKMLVNTECGNFDGFALGDFDKATVARTAMPNKQLFEKMSSGKYLSDVIAEAFAVAKAEGAFEQDVTFCPFVLKDVSAFLCGDGVLTKIFADQRDADFAKDICVELIDRAAKMGAIVNCALAVNSCTDKSLPVALVAEGTTFNKLPGFKGAFVGYVQSILADHGMTVQLVQGEELNLVGTLMATMVL